MSRQNKGWDLVKASLRLLNITAYTTQGIGQNKIQRLGLNKAVVIAGAENRRSVYDRMTINDNVQKPKHTTPNASVKSHVNVFMVRSRLTPHEPSRAGTMVYANLHHLAELRCASGSDSGEVVEPSRSAAGLAED